MRVPAPPLTLSAGRHRRSRAALLLAAPLVAGLLALPQPGTAAGGGATPGSGPTATDCPDSVADLATCYTGQDRNGAFYAMAVPHDWEGDLVVHSHGGPDLGAGSDPERSVEDLDRWSVMVEQGYAWAGSAYRRGGYGVRMAVADTESVREVFADTFGVAGLTLSHGQSWGGNVAARLVELHGDSYDGALLTNGVLAGGSRGYDYRVDLRAVYQYYCRNHPRPSEPRYPVWMGLREDSTLTSTGLRSRLQECTGFESAPEERTEAQQRNLDDILAVTRIPERTLESHLRFATFTFRDIVHERLGGRNPFGNRSVRYSGSHDDRALNRGVERFSPDRAAQRDLSWDSDLTGEVDLPVVTMHAIDDPTAFVEHESAYRASVEGARRGENLVQVFTREAEHSFLSKSEYAAVVDGLARWARGGDRPTPAGVQSACAGFDAAYGTGCFVDARYRPGSYASRVEPRPGGRTWPVLTQRQADAWERRPGPIGIAP